MIIPIQHKKSFTDVIIENNIVKGAVIDYDFQHPNIGQLLLDIFNDNPDYAAWTDNGSGKQMTYAEMKHSSIRLALWLKHQGIGQNDVITSCSPNSLNDYIVTFATFYIGAVCNPWHHGFTLESARHAMKVTKPKIIFTYAKTFDTFTKAAKLENENVKIITYENHPGAESIEDLIHIQKKIDVESFIVRKIENPSSELAGIWFSSGTSGPPKGVMITYQCIFNLMYPRLLENKQNAVLFWCSTLYWITGIEYMLLTVLWKAKVVIYQKYEAEYICQLVENYQVTDLIIEPTIINTICKQKLVDKYKLSSLIEIISCGSKLSEETQKRFLNDFPHINLCDEYGMSESGPIFRKYFNDGSKFYFYLNAQIKIVDFDIGKLLGPNERGEIYIKGPAMTIGYYNNPVSTAATIDKDGWIRSGDIGFYNEIGEISIVDRSKSIIRYQYHYVYPSEIRGVLLSHPDVLDAGITSFPHDEDVEHAIAFVERIPGSNVTEEELVELSATLGYYKKLCGGAKFLDKLPRTASGKISIKTLQDMAKAYAQQ